MCIEEKKCKVVEFASVQEDCVVLHCFIGEDFRAAKRVSSSFCKNNLIFDDMNKTNCLFVGLYDIL